MILPLLCAALCGAQALTLDPPPLTLDPPPLTLDPPPLTLDPPPPTYQYDLRDAFDLFQGFVTKYNRQYRSTEEYENRFKIFKENLIEINKDNAESLRLGKEPASGINIFADQRWTEFSAGVEPHLRVRTAIVYSVLVKIMRRKGL